MFAMPFLEFLHSGRVIKKTQFNTTQKVFQVKNSFVGENATYRIRRLGTFVQPIERLLAIKLNGSRNCQWIVRTDLLDELSISWCTGIGYHDEVKGSLLRPMTLQSDFNWHFK